ncbi:MAG: hypothetical protein JSV25_08560 [Spirochaetota bacterium]|nr:MAG: hypothetical protein JSV25_08560 [Spirochaetota bacterium]
MENDLNILSTKSGFNTALRHFKAVTGYVPELSGGTNLADLVNESIEDGAVQRFQVKAIVNSLLVDKLGYEFKSHNLEESIENAKPISETVSEWGNLHIILAYFHPQTGLIVINSKNEAQWESILPLTRDELIVVYSGPVENEIDRALLKSSIDDFLSLLYGKKVKPKKEYIGERREEVREAVREAVPVAAPKRRVTPRYSIQVTNELFHNGNVEAWKKIVESFTNKYVGLEVLIWYENERINDINALFKWGKVKHGGLIFFSVAGENIKDVSKLQRYLFEGASPRFEVFLRGGIGQVLDLF